MYRTADLLAKSPFGRGMRLVNKDNTTAYTSDLKAMVRQVAVGGRVAASGVELFGSILSRSAPGAIVVQPAPDVSPLNMILPYGQSLSIGFNGGSALTILQPAGVKNVAFAGGIVLPSNRNSFVPLVENAGGQNQETGWAGLANWLTANVYGQPRFLVASGGVGSTALSQRIKGTAPYTALMALVDSAVARAAAEGRKLIVRCVPLVDGETDFYGGLTRQTLLTQMQIDLDMDIKAKTGQTETVYLICSGPASFTGGSDDASTSIIMAARQAPQKVIYLGSKYHLPHNADNLHLLNTSYLRMALQFGPAIKTLMEANMWVGFAPLSTLLDGTNIIVIFSVPTEPLQFDFVNVTEPTVVINAEGTPATAWRGFEFFDNSASPRGITGGTVVNPRTLSLSLSGAPTGTASTYRLRYAHSQPTTAGAGPTKGPRGNVRDSTAAPEPYWLGRFSVPIPF